MRPTHRRKQSASSTSLGQKFIVQWSAMFRRLALWAIIVLTLLVFVVFVVQAANQTWDGGASGNSTAWYTASNWLGDAAFPGSQATTSNTDIATIPSSGTSPNIGINGTTSATLFLGAIDFSSANRALGDSAAGSFTFTLNGASVNSVSNVVVRNSGTGTLTLQPQAGGAGTMTIALGNASDNVVNIDSNGGIMISSIISGSSKKLTLGGAGIGTLTLSGVNTFSGDTTISSGKLALSGAGSIANSPTIALAGGATFDVSGLTTALTLASGQALKASGTASSGAIATSATKGLTLASNSPLQFTAFNGTTAPLTISGAGTVTVAGGDPVTVTVANGGTPLPTGDYVLISKGSSGSVTGSAPTSVTVNGDGAAHPASVLIVNQQLILSVSTPTAVRMSNFTANAFNDGVMLEWQSAFEVNNLGYNLYRFENGQRALVTPSLIAGSALMTRAGNSFRSGFSYGWFDSQGSVGTQYMLEAIDLNGEVDAHAPQYAARGGYHNAPRKGRSLMLDELAATGTGPATQQGWPSATQGNEFTGKESGIESGKRSEKQSEKQSGKQSGEQSRKQSNSARRTAAASPLGTQHWIASQPAVKFQVRKKGYYRISRQELVAAGLDPLADPGFLQLYVNGVEQPIRTAGDGSKPGPADSIEFYGTGVDALTTDTQTYYLVNGKRPGLRIGAPSAWDVLEPLLTRGLLLGISTKGENGGWVLPPERIPASFAYTIESKERVVYLPGLINGDVDNIFGRPVTATPATQTLTVRDLAGNGSGALLQVIVQGYTAMEHQVQVRLNGSYVGTISFSGALHQSTTLPINPGLIQEGNNAVTLTAAGGQSDLSFIDAIRVTYPRSYRAENDSLSFSVGASAALVTGFSTSAIRVIDITNPNAVREVAPRISRLGDNYSFWISGSGSGSGSGSRSGLAVRNFIAIADSLVEHPTVTADQPSSLNAGLNDADMVIITPGDFRQRVEPLAAWRRASGMKVSVVDIEDVYDEFSYGSHTPAALRDFLAWSVSHWTRAPHYVLLAGDSSWDPRNYLGQGYNDYVPTKMIGTFELETASDDWLVDFDADGAPDMAVGRLPARTSADAGTMVTKILSYEQERAAGGPLRGALLVADQGFETQTENVRSLLAPMTTVQTLSRAVIGNDNSMRTQIVDAINQGPAIVNYFGHGSVGVWTGAGLLNRDTAGALTNGSRPSLFVLMTCLNGYSHEAAADSLGETLMKNPQGGAFAVWASSGQTAPVGQAVMSEQFYRLLLGGQGMTLGDAIRQAKMSTGDFDVRRTWILLGDPSMRLR